MNLNIFYTTCGKNSEAKKLAKKILKDNFANCINIIKNVESFYKDSSKINNSVEVILIIKTIKQFEDMKLYLEDNHPYETPFIGQIKLDNLNEKYVKWILQNI